MFYHFDQNNSGGWFDDRDGLAAHVLIEASTPFAANLKAQSLGIYFDEGFMRDCSCCGQRWHPATAYDETETPTIYGGPIEDMQHLIAWTDPFVIVHYEDGTVQEWSVRDEALILEARKEIEQ